mmetsp:Transcript_8510/g.14328  ORF Transcript_8510/g.14328 Transcript_8510/m.14328 type:complete len:307 (+) Transcript_8510:295-1215(+)
MKSSCALLFLSWICFLRKLVTSTRRWRSSSRSYYSAMASSSFLSFQNSANSLSSCFASSFSFCTRFSWFLLLFSMACFISNLLFSFSSKSWVALFSASATCLLRISSCWSLTFMRSPIWRSTSLCLIICLCLKRSSSLVFFRWMRASCFLAYSSILLSSSFSFMAISDWILSSSSLACLNSSRVLAARFFLSRSFILSFSSSSSTCFFISWPSISSSFNFLMKSILNSSSWSCTFFALTIFLLYSFSSFWRRRSSYSCIFCFSSSSHYFSISFSSICLRCLWEICSFCSEITSQSSILLCSALTMS